MDVNSTEVPNLPLVARTRGSRAALAGLVFALLFTAGWVLTRASPSLDASDAEMLDYFESSSRRQASSIAALYVLPFAAIAFIWFAAAFRDRVVRGGGREHTMLATVHLMSATLFATALFFVAAIELTLVWRIESGSVDPAGARATIAIGTATGQLIALRIGAVFVAISTTRALRSGLFPRWYGYLSFGIAAALLLVATQVTVVMLALPLWVLVSSLLVLIPRRNREELVES
ncbi:hypothetical protein [Ilumatobacter nonamiensis]|uniref:hypothetical protein n=1 Tax=Ilumatobacter nonamiensis TaxID=467093 RepID=UPI000349CB03|nr:hypothetical protein [Ilumatobacter nonamiensis]